MIRQRVWVVGKFYYYFFLLLSTTIFHVSSKAYHGVEYIVIALVYTLIVSKAVIKLIHDDLCLARTTPSVCYCAKNDLCGSVPYRVIPFSTKHTRIPAIFFSLPFTHKNNLTLKYYCNCTADSVAYL